MSELIIFIRRNRKSISTSQQLSIEGPESELMECLESELMECPESGNYNMSRNLAFRIS